ncbi:hypothetical protein NB647_08425 [Oxalobacter aliiformigenes]|uniref:hypothetical protein n=1 Tax=Oxalobacter aliiformigenes TaxID=2946593 RepID=UPI0022B02EF4|nr:hypothetical protein [Oxalobacter aliiformigenes]WAV88892.1 hypothetical protein NB647_08425 [Oxalobacter aliiformigenes]
MSQEQDLSLAQDVHNTILAIKDGRLHIKEELKGCYEEILNVPLNGVGVEDTTALSSEAKSLARATGKMLKDMFFRPEVEEAMKESEEKFTTQELQSNLFELFEKLFIALVGATSHSISDLHEIHVRFIDRLKHQKNLFEKEFNRVLESLLDFYNAHKFRLYTDAIDFGGAKFVVGGQRAFLKSALNGVRIAGLCSDTQLIPDPVYPHVSGNMHLNAVHLQLAETLFYILKLKPLIDAHFVVPPVYIFPSFELELEENDAITKQGIGDMLLKLVSPVCDGAIYSFQDLVEYSKNHETKFIDAVMAKKLFIPPGSSPNEILSGEKAVRKYISEEEHRRDTDMIDMMKRMPRGLLILMGISERLGPQYHLFDNSQSLHAQPLLNQEVHWHYYMKCCEASAQTLVNNKILSNESFQTMQALQDQSMSWLANIPIEGLVELRKKQEHEWFQFELKKYTNQLAEAGGAEISDVVREVNHGLSCLMQRYQKDIVEIEKTYAGKVKDLALKAGGAGVGAFMTLFPFLSPILGNGVAAGIGALGAVAAGAFPVRQHQKAQEGAKQKINQSMLGMLATAKNN